LTVSTYGRWLKKKAPGALDRLDRAPDSLPKIASAVAGGSKVVAKRGYAQHPQTGANLKPQARSGETVVPPTRIERATRGLGNRCSIQLSYGGVAELSHSYEVSVYGVGCVL
jgi:hypothetical protein